MVTTLNITLDDTVADRARDVKDERDLTWPEFVEAATDALEDQEQHESQPNEPESAPRVRDEPEPTLGAEHTTIDVPGWCKELR